MGHIYENLRTRLCNQKPACTCRFLILAFSLVHIAFVSKAQYSPPLTDTGKNSTHAQAEALLKKLSGITITGFMEPEFQVGQSKGENTFSGGNFPANSNSRFIIRRGRLRTTYTALDKNALPYVEICFEVDGTQKGVTINEFWGRVYENKWQVLSFSTGMLVRPFGYEINYPTRQFDSPERGRMSQTLMRGEVDLGAMISFEPRKKDNPLRYFKASAGIFNGQGLTGPTEFDSFKDIIGRVCLKPYPLAPNLFLSAGISYFTGGIEQNSRYIYHAVNTAGGKINMIDSAADNVGKKAPRRYFGTDLQLKWVHKKGGATEIRAEYWQGKQAASLSSSETPASLLLEPYSVRNFNGAFFYLLHSITARHQLCAKYDFYDPNTDVCKSDIGRPASNFSAADIKYSTWGLGYIYYWNLNLKLMLWYDIVRNEATQLNGYTSDVKDNVFTCRLQFKF